MVQGGPGHRHQEGEEVLRGEEEVRGPRGRDHRPARDQGIYVSLQMGSREIQIFLFWHC